MSNVLQNIISSDISGDNSTPYKSWRDYERAVSVGDEEAPRELTTKKRPEYEFNVDKALDSIDLTFKNYTPSRDAVDFFNVIRLVYGEDAEIANSTMHYFLVDLVFGNIKRDQYPYSKEIQGKIRINNNKIAIIASRMSAKSTVLTAWLPIYLAVKGVMPNFGKMMFVVGFGDSQQAGAKVQANTIRDICEESEFCKEYFEKMRFTDEECEFHRRGSGKVKSRAFMYKVKGAAGGSVRGIRYKTERPQMFLFDDIIKNEADANSKIIMAKLKSMIYADAENALGRIGKIVIVNTPFNKSDPVYSALESGVWTPVCLPICERISLDLKKEDFISSWKAMHTYERTMERFEDAHYGDTEREFMQELMLRISSEDDQMVPDKLIQWFDRTITMRALQSYSLYITTDFTTTSKSHSDFSGLSVWAISANNDWLLLDVCVRRQGIGEQYDELFRMVRTWANKGATLEVGVETDGQQKAHIYALKEEMLKRNTYFTFARQKGAAYGNEGILSRAIGGNKHARFRMILPQFQNKKVFFAEQLRDTPDMEEALSQLKYTTHTGFASSDDFLDTVSQLGMMEIILPVQDPYDNKVEEKSDSIWDDIYEDDSDSVYDSYA